MQKTRREVSMDELSRKQSKLSDLFNAPVCIQISNVNKNQVIFFSDSLYSKIAKRFLGHGKMISSPKNRIMVSFIVSNTNFPHNEVTLNKNGISKILRTNYIIHEMDQKPCVSFFLMPDRKIL